jgi:hypothetical protein
MLSSTGERQIQVSPSEFVKIAMLCPLLDSEDDLKSGASALVDRAEDVIDRLIQPELRAIQDVGDASALHVPPRTDPPFRRSRM